MTTKAERSRGMPRRSLETQVPPSRLPIIIGGALLLVLAVAAIAAIAMSAGPSSSVAEPANRPIAITGDALPAFSDPASDAAVGRPLPQLSGTGVDGQPVSFGPGNGPMAVVVLAHWCAYCQSEVPPLVSYLDADRLPDGVSLVALTTSIDPARPNYPPSRWLENEGWAVPTLIDDSSNRGLQALGMSSFPAFVFVDADGRVAYRNTGALGAENFHAIVEQLAR